MRTELPPAACTSSFPGARAWNIGVRTAHIASTSVLVGGHAFDVHPSHLYLVLWLAIATGSVLILLEAFSVRLRWAIEGRGLMVLAKLALLLLIPFAWSARVSILFAVIVLASVGSHMPARFRYRTLLNSRF